jgi:hypothetical protein
MGIDEVRDVLYAAPFARGAIALDWAAATRVDAAPSDLREAAEPGATFEPVPPAGLQSKSYAAWSKDFSRWLPQSEKLELMRQRDLKLTSNPDETERDFKIRIQEARRAARDAAVDALQKKYAPKKSQIAEQLRRAQASVDRETAQATQQKLQTGLSVGATILGALFRGKALSAGTLGRATTAARGMSRTMKESNDIKRASENVEALREREKALDEEILAETTKISVSADADAPVERISLAPKRGQISVQLVGLGWMPAK